MKADAVFPKAKKFAALLKKLRSVSRAAKANARQEGHRRKSVSSTVRAAALASTGSRCHICGGKIKKGHAWGVDHVLARSHGGTDSDDNYLPAHGICNRSRWSYSEAEIRWILKMGAWFRTQVEREVPTAMKLAERFVSEQTDMNLRPRKRRR